MIGALIGGIIGGFVAGSGYHVAVGGGSLDTVVVGGWGTGAAIGGACDLLGVPDMIMRLLDR